MEKKLPNATTAMILGIVSFICCPFSAGIGGVILSGIALFLSNKDRKLYLESPEEYINYNQSNTARIIAIIGLALGVIILVMAIYQIQAAGGWDAYLNQVRDIVEQAQEQAREQQ